MKNLAPLMAALLVPAVSGSAVAGDPRRLPPPKTVNLHPLPEHFVDLETQDQHVALEAKLRPWVVEVRRELPPRAGMRVPGGERIEGLGLVAGEGAVVTAMVLVEGWAPENPEDRIMVRAFGAEQWLPGAVGIEEKHLGLAVLDVPELEAAAGPKLPSAEQVEQVVWTGRPLFAVVAPARGLSRVVVGVRGLAGLAYYWRIQGGDLLAGTPLFGADGTLISVVGQRRLGEPVEVYILPSKALLALFDERGATWQR